MKKIKVLNVIGEIGYGGAELLTIEISKQVSCRDIDVSIAVLGFCQPEVVELTELAGLRLFRFNSSLLSPLNIFRIWYLIWSGVFDVVHVHLFPSIYWVALAGLFCNRKVSFIYTEHSTGNGRRKFVWLRSLERWVYARYMVVVCICRDVQDSLIGWLPGLKSSVVINNGINLKRFSDALPVQRKILNFESGDKLIFMAGAFRVEKNQITLVRSLQHLPENYKLVLAGIGSEFERVKSEALLLGIADRVCFLGAVSNVECFMKTADVYVLPSFFEGFGLSAVEAAAAGLPIVYADVSGLRALFSGVGVPIDPTCAVSIAAGVLRATSTEEFRSKLVIDSLAMAQKYDLQEAVKSYCDLYRMSVKIE